MVLQISWSTKLVTQQGVLSMGGYQVTNMGMPLAEADVVSKEYTDILHDGIKTFVDTMTVHK